MKANEIVQKDKGFGFFTVVGVISGASSVNYGREGKQLVKFHVGEFPCIAFGDFLGKSAIRAAQEARICKVYGELSCRHGEAGEFLSLVADSIHYCYS